LVLKKYAGWSPNRSSLAPLFMNPNFKFFAIQLNPAFSSGNTLKDHMAGSDNPHELFRVRIVLSGRKQLSSRITVVMRRRISRLESLEQF
jgi:hypothetical protein